MKLIDHHSLEAWVLRNSPADSPGSCPTTLEICKFTKMIVLHIFSHRPTVGDDCLGLDSCAGSHYIPGESKEFEFAKSAAVRQDIVNGDNLCRWSREGGRQVARDSAFEAAPLLSSPAATWRHMAKPLLALSSTIWSLDTLISSLILPVTITS